MNGFPSIEEQLSLQRLNNELAAAGIVFSGVDSAGNISNLQAGQESLAALIIAARNKILASAECLAVQSALGGASDPRWIAYKAVRQDIVNLRRNVDYLNKAIILLADLLINGTYRADPQGGGFIPTWRGTELTAIRDAINAVKAKYPDAG